MYQVPGSVYQAFTIFGQTQEQVTGPDDAWSRAGGRITPMEGDDLADARAGVERDMILLCYPAVARDYVLQADEPSDGLVRIEVRGPSGKPFDLFLQADTGLPALVAYSGKHPMTGAAAEFREEYGDFRTVDGLSRPYHIVTRIDGNVFAEATVTKILVNPDVAADRFRRPNS